MPRNKMLVIRHVELGLSFPLLVELSHLLFRKGWQPLCIAQAEVVEEVQNYRFLSSK